LLWAAGGALSYLEEIGVLAACLSSVKVAPFDALPLGHVALDGSTLVNLEILEGPACLLSLLDHTVTAQGARLFRQWCCAPLVDSERIAERLAATDVVRRNADWANQLRVDLKHVPDLERLAALCAVGTCGASKLAVLVLGMQRAWNALVTSLSANTSLRMPFQKGFDYEGVATALDQAATLSAASGAVLEGLLRLTRDWAAVKESGVLEPGPTVDEHADNTRAGLEEVKRALNELLRKAKEHLGTSDVAFVDVGKTRYLLDVPASARQRALNSGYKLINSTKQRDRFARKESEDLVDQLLELEDVMQGRCQSFLVLAQKHVVAASETVSELSRAVAEVDCLLSLAAFVDAHPGELCRPLVLARGQPWLEAVELKHPVCLKVSLLFVRFRK
jgi:DNA mismatch repair protein MSH6